MGAIVICRWGEELQLLDSRGALASRAPVADGDVVPAILEMIAAEPVRPKRARIVYQPEGMELHALPAGAVRLGSVARTGGGRRRLRRSLAGDFPALAEPGAIWCLWPARSPGADAGATLHLEGRSCLPHLVDGLAAAGLSVDGAWPLAALGEAAAGSPTRGCVTFAASAGRALVSWIIPGGEAGVEDCAGENLAEAAVATLRGALARFDENARPAGRLAVEGGPAATLLRDAASGLGLVEITMAELLGWARQLPPGTWADFLPGSPWHARTSVRRRIAGALGAAALAAVAGHGWSGHLEKERRLRERADDEARRWLRRAESAAAADREHRINTLAGELTEMETPAQHHYELLAAIARSVPPGLVVRRLAIAGQNFEIAGRLLDGALPAGDSLAGLRRDLAAPGAPWTLLGPAQVIPASDFALAGRFQADSSGSPPSERLASQLDAARARLPSRASFDAGVRPWGPRWIVASQACESRAGWEIRHLALAYDRPGLRDWPDIVDSVKSLCGQPGLTIDRLELASAPNGTEAFLQAGLRLTVRLRW